jgi:hypothetical protein
LIDNDDLAHEPWWLDPANGILTIETIESLREFTKRQRQVIDEIIKQRIENFEIDSEFDSRS